MTRSTDLDLIPREVCAGIAGQRRLDGRGGGMGLDRGADPETDGLQRDTCRLYSVLMLKKPIYPPQNPQGLPRIGSQGDASIEFVDTAHV